MKQLYTLLLLTFISAFTFAQCDGRYQTEIFSSVTVTEVNYSDVYNDNEHSMDIYTPDGDTEIKSIPLVFSGSPGDITVTFIPVLTKPLAKCVEYAPSPDQ